MPTVKDVAKGLVSKTITLDEAKDLLQGVQPSVTQTNSDIWTQDAQDPDTMDDNSPLWLEYAFIMGAITNGQVDELANVMT